MLQNQIKAWSGEGGILKEQLDWKSRFYEAYVSSGQAVDTGENAENMFGSRFAYLNHIVTQYVPQDRNVRILELACGPGAMLYVLDRAGYRDIAGVDISEEQIAVAKRLGISTASCGTLEEFLAGQEAESVDVVMAIDILEHMTRTEIMDVLDAVRRVLKPGGRCIAHVPNGEGLHGMEIRYGDFTHEMAFTRLSSKQVFSVAGFSRVRCFEDKPRVHGLKSLARRILWDLGTLPKRLLHTAETGAGGVILSQCMIIEATR